MKIRRKQRQARPGSLKTIILVLLAIILIVFICAFVNVINRAIQISNEIPDVTKSTLFNYTQKSKIYASDGVTVLAELQLENRQPVDSLNDISPYIVKGTVATEDARFYEHNGVEIVSLFRAALAVLFGGSTQGGSTITMQLMRNTILTKDAQTISLERKLAEIILATRIEEIYSKDEILLMYLNTINYGDGCYGIKAAAEHYFSKAQNNLTLREAATLIGIPQSPSNLSPTVNVAASTQRRNVVLGRMRDTGVITAEEAAAAQAVPIQLNLTYADLNTNYKYPYFTTYVRDQLMQKYTAAEIFEGGWQIYSTLDIKMQEANDAGCAAQYNTLESGAECAAVSVDPSNGFITSMVGGKDFGVNQFNIAAQKGRPTGSSFKMFTLVTAIEQGYNPYRYTLDCTSPMTVGNTKIQNVDGTSYGTKTIQGATAVSSNTGFVRLAQKVGNDEIIKTAKKMGVKNANLPNVTTLTLGVADVTPLEMASAFSTLASGGIYHEPVAIKRIDTRIGETIYNFDEKTDGVGQRVLSEDTAGAATKVLKTVFTSGTATSARLANRQPVAGKTGTSEDWRDHTLVGYTPHICLATWIGKRDYTQTHSTLTCNALFKAIMDRALVDAEVEDFPVTKDPEYTINYNNGSSWNDYDSDKKDQNNYYNFSDNG